MGIISQLTKFVSGTKAVAKDINDNFESLRLGNNENYSLTNDLTVKFNNLNVVNVKDFGAVGNGVQDDTEAIKKAIHAVSPICTSYEGIYLANFTPGTGTFSTNNAYRYGGIVYLPAGTYKISDTIYLNQGVQLVGEGRVSNGFYNLSSPTGTIINFQPESVNDKIAIDITGFDKNTGKRISTDSANIVKSWGPYDEGAISSIRGAAVKNLSVVCKDGVTAGIRLTGATQCHLENVAVQGTPKAAIVMSASLGGSFINTHGTSSTQGIVAYAVNSWKLVGECYFNQSGTRGSFVYTYPDFPAYDCDLYHNYSTGFYGAYINAFDIGALCMEHWDRAFYTVHALACNINQLYLEDIKSLVFNFVQSSITIINPYIDCSAANVFYLQNIQNITQPGKQIRLNGLGYANFNKFIAGGDSNEANALLVDIPDYYLNNNCTSGSNATYYSWVTFTNFTRNETYTIYVDCLTGNDNNWGNTKTGAVATIKGALARCRTDKINVINFINGQKHYTNTTPNDIFSNLRLVFQGNGALSGVTGNISAATNILTVNSAANLRVGQYISIAGAGTSGAVLNTSITAINGTILTLNDNAVTAVTNAAVNYQRALLIAYNDSGYGRFIPLRGCDLRVEYLDLTLDPAITTYKTLFSLLAHNKVNFYNSNISIPVDSGLFSQVGSIAATLNVCFTECNVTGAGYIGNNADAYSAGKCTVIGVKQSTMYGNVYSIANQFNTTRFSVVSYI